MELYAVVETGWTFETEPPWAFRPHEWGYLRLAGIDAADLGYVVALLASYNNISFGASAEETLANIAVHEDDLVLPGGADIVVAEGVIHPGCCSGLEEWSEWEEVRGGASGPFLGHDPGPWVERLDDGVRVWSDDREKPDVFSVFAPWEAYEAAVAGLRTEIGWFLEDLEGWAGDLAPENAARFVEKIQRSLRVRD